MMQKFTLLLLALLVGALGFGVWWSSGQVVEFEEALFPGIQGVEVVSIRVDNLVRDVQVRIDRDGEGGWALVDPIEAPADEVTLEGLMDVIDSDRLRLVPGEIDAATFGFEPPEIVFQVETRSGERRSVEVGAVDVAHNSVHVRVRGKIYRAPLRLHTELTRDVHGYRRPYVFTSRVEGIGEFSRTGESLGGTHRFGYELHAILDNDGWRLTSPFSAGLHPGPMSLFLTNTIRIPVRSYFTGNHEPEALGFEPPGRTFRMVELGGDRFELQIGHGAGSASFNARALPGGDPFKTDADSVHRLEIPLDLLLDRRAMRASRELVERIEIEREGQPSLHLARSSDGWSVSDGNEANSYAADPRLFEQFLAKLEGVLFYDMVEVGTLSSEEVVARVRFVGKDEEWALSIGGEYTDAGEECLRVQQAGDGIVGLLKVSDAGFLDTSVSDLRDHRLSTIDELLVSGIALHQGSQQRRWNRDDKGEWTREGLEQEAFEILALLDPLFHLRAESFVSSEIELSDPLLIEVFQTTGETTEVRLGEAQVGGRVRSVLIRAGEFAVLALDQQGLPNKIRALLAAD